MAGLRISFFPGESFTVTFSAPVQALGIYFNVRASAAASDYIFIDTPYGRASSGGNTFDIDPFFFVGVVSDAPFSTATFGATLASPSGFNVDNMIRATLAVPEPSTWMLLLIGVLLLPRLARTEPTMVPWQWPTSASQTKTATPSETAA